MKRPPKKIKPAAGLKKATLAIETLAGWPDKSIVHLSDLFGPGLKRWQKAAGFDAQARKRIDTIQQALGSRAPERITWPLGDKAKKAVYLYTEPLHNTFCTFVGSLDGQETVPLMCETARAGTNAYALASIIYADEHWMLDISGLPAQPGRAEIRVKGMRRKDGKTVGIYEAKLKTTVRTLPQDQSLRQLDLSRVVLKSRSPSSPGSGAATKGKGRQKAEGGAGQKGKKRYRLAGRLIYDPSLMGARSFRGAFSISYDQQQIGPIGARLEPWNDGYQLTGIFIKGPGDTLNLTANIPGLEDGKQRGSLQLLHMTLGQSGQLESEVKTISSVPYQLNRSAPAKGEAKASGEKEAADLKLSFETTLKQETGSIPLSGSFVARTESEE